MSRPAHQSWARCIPSIGKMLNMNFYYIFLSVSLSLFSTLDDIFLANDVHCIASTWTVAQSFIHLVAQWNARDTFLRLKRKYYVVDDD